MPTLQLAPGAMVEFTAHVFVPASKEPKQAPDPVSAVILKVTAVEFVMLFVVKTFKLPGLLGKVVTVKELPAGASNAIRGNAFATFTKLPSETAAPRNDAASRTGRRLLLVPFLLICLTAKTAITTDISTMAHSVIVGTEVASAPAPSGT